MIRCIASKGSEGGRGEGSIPSVVNEKPVKANEGGGVTAVRPSVLPVTQGQFNKTQLIDRIVEQRSFGGVKAVIISIIRIAAEIKIAADDPRNRITWDVSREAEEEIHLNQN